MAGSNVIEGFVEATTSDFGSEWPVCEYQLRSIKLLLTGLVMVTLI